MKKLCFGIKSILPTPMTLGDYNKYQGWTIPEDQNPNDEGYLVEYQDGGKANHPNHEGYISWSPKEVFDNAYKASGEMSFGMAIEAAKRGNKIARSGWNGKNMWLILVPGSPSVKPVAGTPYSKAGLVEETNICSHIDMYTAAGEMQPGWLASQSDMLADDWCIVE